MTRQTSHKEEEEEERSKSAIVYKGKIEREKSSERCENKERCENEDKRRKDEWEIKSDADDSCRLNLLTNNRPEVIRTLFAVTD
jgi:hypothetical protein